MHDILWYIKHVIPVQAGIQKKFTQYREMLMETKVKDLTVEELQSLISDTIKSTLEDLIEDMLALSSDEYLQSIEEARKDYKEG
ncbi:MAG: hypothetical protein AAB116_08520 [Candidatus Poribacteria bacterium]